MNRFIAVVWITVIQRLSAAYYDPYPSPDIYVDLCANHGQAQVISCQARSDETAGWVEIGLIDGEPRILNGDSDVNLSTGGIVSTSSNERSGIYYLHLSRLSMSDNGARIACYKMESDPLFTPQEFQYTTTVTVSDCESQETTPPTSTRKSMSSSMKAKTTIVVPSTMSKPTSYTMARKIKSDNPTQEAHTNSGTEEKLQSEEVTKTLTTVIPIFVVVVIILTIIIFVLLRENWTLKRK